MLSEIDFLALDKPEDVRKLRSTEYTGIAFNELQYIEKELFDEADSRLRYPSKDEGGLTGGRSGRTKVRQLKRR